MSVQIESNVVPVAVIEADSESEFPRDAAPGSEAAVTTEATCGQDARAGDDAYVADWVI